MIVKDRFDVYYKGNRAWIEPHFCREYGCFGSDKFHGMSFEEAKSNLVEYYKRHAEYVRGVKKGDWQILGRME